MRIQFRTRSEMCENVKSVVKALDENVFKKTNDCLRCGISTELVILINALKLLI